MNRRVAMVVRNTVAADSRVRKSAAALATAGWDVTVVGTSADSEEHLLELDGVPVVLVPVRPSFTAADAEVLAGRDAALRGAPVRPLPQPSGPVRSAARTLAGALTPGGGWRRLDPGCRPSRSPSRRSSRRSTRGDPRPRPPHRPARRPLPPPCCAAAALTRLVHDAHELRAQAADRGAGGLRGLLRRRMVAGMLAELVPTAAAVVTVSDQLADRLRADLRLRERRRRPQRTTRRARPSRPSLRERAGVARTSRCSSPPAAGSRARPRPRGARLAAAAPPSTRLVAPDATRTCPCCAPRSAAAGGHGCTASPTSTRRGGRPSARRAPGSCRCGTGRTTDLPGHQVPRVREVPAARRQRRPRDGGVHPRSRPGRGFAVGAGDETDAAPSPSRRPRAGRPGRYRSAYRSAPTLRGLTWEEQARTLTASTSGSLRGAASAGPGVQPCPAGGAASFGRFGDGAAPGRR